MLKDWAYVDDLPAGLDVAAVTEELAEANRPAPPQEVKRHIKILIGYFGTPTGSDEQIYAMVLAKVLSDLPGDLLPLAVDRAIRRLRFPPKAAELTALIAPEQAQRSALAARIKAAALKARLTPSALQAAGRGAGEDPQSQRLGAMPVPDPAKAQAVRALIKPRRPADA